MGEERSVEKRVKIILELEALGRRQALPLPIIERDVPVSRYPHVFLPEEVSDGEDTSWLNGSSS